jgi:hypothetical protein
MRMEKYQSINDLFEYNVDDKRAGQTSELATSPESSTHFMTILNHNALNQLKLLGILFLR